MNYKQVTANELSFEDLKRTIVEFDQYIDRIQKKVRWEPIIQELFSEIDSYLKQNVSLNYEIFYKLNKGEHELETVVLIEKKDDDAVEEELQAITKIFSVLEEMEFCAPSPVKSAVYYRDRFDGSLQEFVRFSIK